MLRLIKYSGAQNRLDAQVCSRQLGSLEGLGCGKASRITHVGTRTLQLEEVLGTLGQVECVGAWVLKRWTRLYLRCGKTQNEAQMHKEAQVLRTDKVLGAREHMNAQD